MQATTQADLDVITHTVHAILRTGAGQFELGYLDEEPPHRWWATATYAGAKITCHRQDDPVKAVLGLYAMLAAGGDCAICDRTVVLHHSERGLVDGARMHHGVFQTRVAKGEPERYCIRRLELDGWTTCPEADR